MKKFKPWVLIRQAGIVLLALLVVVFWFNRDRGSKLETFCNNISVGSHYETVLQSAESHGFSIPFYAREENRITIFNKEGMLYEYGCTVQFREALAIGATFFKR